MRHLLLTLLLTLSACSPALWPPHSNSPILHESFTLVYGEDGTTLSLREQARFNSFIKDLQARDTEQIRIKVAKRSESAVTGAAQLKSALMSNGFSAGQIYITATDQASNQIGVWIEYRPAPPMTDYSYALRFFQ